MRILDKINDVKSLRKLSLSELEKLAHEIREYLVEVVSNTGGHLASNLGVVEISLALHYVFNTPIDKIIWDVGHQCYVHKILTGRKDKLNTLRQYGGLSGFPKRKESEFDTFDCGHSSTSLSLAAGLLCARDHKKMDYNVIAVIGDGSLTGGMAFEAMNNIGQLQKEVIIILNDNKMSISENVGALSNYLNSIITSRSFNKLKLKMESMISSIPVIGKIFLGFINKMEESIKGFITPGMLFEELGFRYIGPIDGHDLKSLVNTFDRVKVLKGRPIIMHVATMKGKGYSFAEDLPDKFHGIGKFEIATGIKKTKSEQKTYSSILGDVLTEIAGKDKKVFALTAAMKAGTGLVRFAEEFPDRFFDVGIAEQHCVTFAAALAADGLNPAVVIYSSFLQRAYDQLIHDVCIQELPVKFFIDRSGIVGEDGETHQGIFDISFLNPIPNILIMSPKDENEFKNMIYTAMNYNKGPVAVRYPRGSGPGVEIQPGFKMIDTGKEELLRKGKDVIMIATGSMVSEAMKAVEILRNEKLDAGVINCRIIKPLPEKQLTRICSEYKYIITIEENVSAGGLGSEILRLINFKKGHILNIGLPDKFIEHGNQMLLKKRYGLDANSIANLVKEFVKR